MAQELLNRPDVVPVLEQKERGPAKGLSRRKAGTDYGTVVVATTVREIPEGFRSTRPGRVAQRGVEAISLPAAVAFPGHEA
jgi:hypothetical protein